MSEDRVAYVPARSHGKTQLAAWRRDDAIARGETVHLVSTDPVTGGIHICTVKPFRRTCDGKSVAQPPAEAP